MTFLDGLVDTYAPMGDQLLWRVTKDGGEITCHVRDVRRRDYVAVELRVAHNGETYLTELYTDRVAFQRRATELRQPRGRGLDRHRIDLHAHVAECR